MSGLKRRKIKAEIVKVLFSLHTNTGMGTFDKLQSETTKFINSMKTVMIIIGVILMSLIVVFETLVKIVWSIIYSIIRPIVKNSRYNDAMWDYAFKWKYNFAICDWIGNLWRD